MDDKISRKNLLDYLGEIEKRIPVDTWTINDIHIWPLLKTDLFFKLVNLERSDLYTNSKPKRKIFKVWTIVKGTPPSLFKYLQLKFAPKKKSIPYFFSDSGSHRVWFEGKFINRYFNPLQKNIREITNNGSSLTINDDIHGFQNYPKDETILFIHRYISGSKVFRLFKNNFYSVNCPQFELFLKDLQISFPILEIKNSYLKEIKNRIFNILAISDIIELLIKRHKPKVIFELCYYNTLRFAINYAAFNNKIPTVEIQHGGLGGEHVAYSGWGRVPVMGYNLLPKTFWTWDKNSEQIIYEWAKNNTFHQTVVGGNPWINFAVNHSKSYQFSVNKKIILYTLQNDIVSEFIYEAISNSPAEYEWWIRTHPRFPAVGKNFKDESEKRGLSERLVLENANNYPLPIILNKSGIHLSGNSGAILEAAILGIPSLILDKTGENYYQKLIISKEAFPVYPKNAYNLLSLIKKLFQTKNKVEGNILNINNYEILKNWV